MGSIQAEPLFWFAAKNTPIPHDRSHVVWHAKLPVNRQSVPVILYRNDLHADEYLCYTETRHACDQGDGLDSYTWTEYDARERGVQVIKDSKNNVEITTEFLKVPGGNHGGSWAARIKGKPINPGRSGYERLVVKYHMII
jgi:hypothetical protein